MLDEQRSRLYRQPQSGRCFIWWNDDTVRCSVGASWRGVTIYWVCRFWGDNQGTPELYKDGKSAEIATSVLQFIFLSVTGFRFSFSYMLVKSVTTIELHTIVMDIFHTLASFEFKVIFVCMDGAAINRSFCNTIKACNSAIAMNIVWLYSNLYCIMDVSHVIKKLRNFLFASGSGEQHKRRILHRLGYIDWDMFVNAYMWNCNHHTLRIHRKLSNEHFVLNNSLKMRNHLADQVLNSDMLYLMQSYSQSLESPNALHACTNMSKHTALVIDILRSYLPISSPNDERLSDLWSCANFFRNWQIFCSDNKENTNNFFTKESYSDLIYCLNGFIYMCKEYVNEFPIQPNMINSDIVENIFCEQWSMALTRALAPLSVGNKNTYQHALQISTWHAHRLLTHTRAQSMERFVTGVCMELLAQ